MITVVSLFPWIRVLTINGVFIDPYIMIFIIMWHHCASYVP